MDDTMMGMCTELNIADTTEVFSPPTVVMQGMKSGLKAGSSMNLLTGWNFELKADRDRAIKQIYEDACRRITPMHILLDVARIERIQHEA